MMMIKVTKEVKVFKEKFLVVMIFHPIYIVQKL